MKMKTNRQLSGIFKGNDSGVMDGWVNIDKDCYYVLQLTPPEGATLSFND